MQTQIVKRMLSEKEAQEYTGLKRGKCREFGEEIRCITHVGRRVLYDRTVIDAYFDRQMAANASDHN